MVFYSGLFFHSQAIQEFISQPRVVELLVPIIGPDFWVRWDQAVAKHPGADTFAWHQDNGYSLLHDGYYQLWVALSDMTLDNGGLWLDPGSHRRLLPHRTIGSHRVHDGTPQHPVFVGAQAGDVVVFSSLLLHSTTPNTTQQARWAYVVEYMSIHHFDPGAEPPYLEVARAGKPAPRFVDSFEGRRDPLNRLKYLGYRQGLHWPSVLALPRRFARALRRERA
jgi:ectoine hydroxylase-related dioxygenase (phytanoyl-CoA dioxygenase family)